MKSNLIAKIIFITAGLLQLQASAYTLMQIKGDKALVDTENQMLQAGDNLVSQQTKSQFQVLQVKGNRAVVKIQSGSPQAGEKLAMQSAAPIMNSPSAAPSLEQPMTTTPVMQQPSASPAPMGANRKLKKGDDGIVYRNNMMKLGLLFKIMSHAISTKQADSSTPANTETVAMKGMNFGVGASLDYPLFNGISARGMVSLEQFDVKGTASFNSCDGKTSTNCNAQLMYLTLGGFGRYDLTKDKTAFWVGGGGTLKIPLTKKSTSLNESDIKMANTIAIAAGMDYSMDNKHFIPASFEYHYSLNKSDTVPVIDEITIQGGYGFKF